ncbi:SURF6 family protein [Megaselia abdita]
MQLKMPQNQQNSFKFDKGKMKKLLQEENDYIVDLLTTFDVPNSVEDEQLTEMYLLSSKEAKKLENGSSSNSRAQTAEELEDRLNIIKNKMKAKKKKISERGMKKREAKKLKKNKEFKKILVSASKAMHNENVKVIKSDQIKKEDDGELPKVKTVFNAEGKIVFSKIDFASSPGGKFKKSKKDKTIKNPKLLLKKLKEGKRKINELKEQGEDEKVKEIQSEQAWKKAFDKVEGKKVKDDPKLLIKAIKKKKDVKKKSKREWKERTKKVEAGIASKQKKRQENIDKKKGEKKSKKIKKMTKKGRIIPGF